MKSRLSKEYDDSYCLFVFKHTKLPVIFNVVALRLKVVFLQFFERDEENRI